MKLLSYLIMVVAVFGLIGLGCQESPSPTGASLSDQTELGEEAGAKPTCTTIQDGVLTYSAGHYLADQPLMVGHDPYGYNYQAHLFNGYYPNVYLGRDGFPPYDGDEETYLAENPGVEDHWTWPYRNVQLLMKWNDAWLSNKDCDGDGLLDRYYGYDSYIGSGAWETNHQWGTYCNLVGEWDLMFVRDDGAKFPHTWTVTSQTNGQFEGTGESGVHDYTFAGEVVETDIQFIATYGSTLPGYTYEAQGTVLPDGTLSGTWEGSNGRYGTWYSASGSATTCNWSYFVKIVAASADAYAKDGVWYTADGTEIGPVIWGSFAIIQQVYNDPCGGYHGIEYLSPAGPGFGKWK